MPKTISTFYRVVQLPKLSVRQSGEFAELREQALQEVDLEERKGILELAQQRINEEGPYAFVLQFGRISATPLDFAFGRDRGV